MEENYSKQPNEYTADIETVLQKEEEYEITAPPIEVKICEPVETKELPPLRSTYYNLTAVTSGIPVKLLEQDPRRKSATICALDANIIVGSTQADARLNGATILNLVPRVINGQTEVWTRAVSTSTDISVQTEYWSD